MTDHDPRPRRENDLPVSTDPDTDTHRGAFGEYGGEAGAFIERTFRERIVLVGVTLAGGDVERTDADLDELELLVDTAGADVVARVEQRRASPDPATYVGKGKARRSAGPPRRSTATPSCSTTSSRLRSSATSRSCSAAPRSTAPR